MDAHQRGLLSEGRFSLHNDILDIRSLTFLQTFMLMVAVSRVERDCWNPFVRPPRCTKDAVMLTLQYAEENSIKHVIL